jgi:hypothetical protein
MQSKFDETSFEVFTKKEKIGKNDIVVLGIRNRFEEKAKKAFSEELEKDDQNITQVLIDLMDKCIEEVHSDGSYEINRPIVYKSLDRGRVKKLNISN